MYLAPAYTARCLGWGSPLAETRLALLELGRINSLRSAASARVARLGASQQDWSERDQLAPIQ